MQEFWPEGEGLSDIGSATTDMSNKLQLQGVSRTTKSVGLFCAAALPAGNPKYACLQAFRG